MWWKYNLKVIILLWRQKYYKSIYNRCMSLAYTISRQQYDISKFFFFFWVEVITAKTHIWQIKDIILEIRDYLIRTELLKKYISPCIKKFDFLKIIKWCSWLLLAHVNNACIHIWIICGVPQGCVLGTLLFQLNSLHLGNNVWGVHSTDLF